MWANTERVRFLVAVNHRALCRFFEESRPAGKSFGRWWHCHPLRLRPRFACPSERAALYEVHLRALTVLAQLAAETPYTVQCTVDTLNDAVCVLETNCSLSAHSAFNIGGCYVNT